MNFADFHFPIGLSVRISRTNRTFHNSYASLDAMNGTSFQVFVFLRLICLLFFLLGRLVPVHVHSTIIGFLWVIQYRFRRLFCRFPSGNGYWHTQEICSFHCTVMLGIFTCSIYERSTLALALVSMYRISRNDESVNPILFGRALIQFSSPWVDSAFSRRFLGLVFSERHLYWSHTIFSLLH